MARKNNNVEKTSLKKWTDISGEMYVYFKERKGKNGKFITGGTSVSVKDDNNNVERFFYTVRFKKDNMPENLSDSDSLRLNIKKGFITFDEYDSKKYPVVVILDYEELEER